ncbi:phage tail tape measure protein, partial [Myxococcota bacterium]|nr:phage tail tape measure protein [Myxococcota bacterium]
FSSNKKIYSVQFKEGGSKQVVSGFLNIGEAAGKSRDRLDTVRDILLSMDSAMSIAGRAAGMLQGAFNALRGPASLAMDFEHQFALIKTLSSEVGDDLEGELLDLAKRVPQTAGDIADAAYRAISAGIDPKEVRGFLEAASKAAVAGNASMTEATVALTKTLAGFKSQGLEATEAMDMLFTIVKRGDTDFSALSESIGMVAGIAGEAGVGIEEMGAALATLTKSAPNTSIAVTQLNAVIKLLKNPTDQSAEAFKQMGIEVGALALKEKGLIPILREIQAATQGNVGLTSTITRDFEAASGLTSLLSQSMQTLEGDLQATSKAAGALGDANAIMSKTSKTALDAFNAIKEGALRDIGDKIMPTVVAGLERLGAIIDENGPAIAAAIEKIVSTLFSLASWVADHGSKIAGFFAAAWGGKALHSAASGIQSLIPALERITPSTEWATGSLQRFAGTLSKYLGPAGLLIAVAGTAWTIGTAIADAIGITAEDELDVHLRSVREKLRQEIKAATDEVSQSVRNSQQDISKLVARGDFSGARAAVETKKAELQAQIVSAEANARRIREALHQKMAAIKAWGDVNEDHSRVIQLTKEEQSLRASLQFAWETTKALKTQQGSQAAIEAKRAELEAQIVSAEVEAGRISDALHLKIAVIKAWGDVNEDHVRVTQLKKEEQDLRENLQRVWDLADALKDRRAEVMGDGDVEGLINARRKADAKLEDERIAAENMSREAARREAAKRAAKAHADEVRRIRKDALRWEIEALEDGAERELALLKLKHD